MSKRVLAIGVGGTGKATLAILKERLLSAYQQVPAHVSLLSLDTDDWHPADGFAGVNLNPVVGENGHEPEFQAIVSRSGVTMDTIFGDMAAGRATGYLDWLEKDKLDRTLGPADRDIRGGAQQRRPIGRVALFQRWADPVYKSILEGITRIYGEEEQDSGQDSPPVEQSKRMIFVVGSLSGGTGSGFLIDVLNLIRHAVKSNIKWQSIDVSALIILPEAFKAYTTLMDDPTNLKPNAYAALRELDRFIRAHTSHRPYMLAYGPDIRAITWNTTQLVDHAYLIDTTSRGPAGDVDLSGDPKRGIFPLAADFLMSHIDQGLGEAMATARSNAPTIAYNRQEGWQYSGFNALSYIFPAEDIITSFSYRFLREMLARQFLPLLNAQTEHQLTQSTLKHTERLFAANRIDGPGQPRNPALVQKALAATRKLEPEGVPLTWAGLFNMIALSDSSFAEDYQDLQGWLDYLQGSFIPSKSGDYKHESFADGAVRLLSVSEQFMEDCLGPRLDPSHDDLRAGGEWDKILNRYPTALRHRFAETLQAAVLLILNQRHPQTQVLEPGRLPAARLMLTHLSERLQAFKQRLMEEYRRHNFDQQLRQAGTSLREAIAWVNDTRYSRHLNPFTQPEALKAQSAYISRFQQLMTLELQQRVYHTVLAVLDALSGADKGLIQATALELETWQHTFRQVDREFLVPNARQHAQNRAEKSRVKVRRYLTDPDFENDLYQQAELSGHVAAHVLGEVRGQKGLHWEAVPAEDQSQSGGLRFKLVTHWTDDCRGAEDIAQKFTAGVRELFAPLKTQVTLADRLRAEFRSPASFVNTISQIDEPFLRYNPASNGKALFHERYVSFNVAHASDTGREFLEKAQHILAERGITVDASAENPLACTVLTVARGARLTAIDQFTHCEADYRAKLHQGRETLHLFPEEQNATSYESRIESLGEGDNRQRSLAPELVVTLGDERKLRAFTLACAYGLIQDSLFTDPESGERSVEIFLNLPETRYRLSDSATLKRLDPSFNDVTAEERLARLTFQALQTFTLKLTEKSGIPSRLIPNLVADLQRQGVSLGHVDQPFSLALPTVFHNLAETMDALSPSPLEEPDQRRREAYTARRCLEQYLHPFRRDKLATWKRSPAPAIRDMATVFHLLLNRDIETLSERAALVLTDTPEEKSQRNGRYVQSQELGVRG